MKNLPNGFIATSVAGMLRDRPDLNSCQLSRILGTGEARAREILDHAREKDCEWRLSHWPRPNHDNQLKEWNR